MISIIVPVYQAELTLSRCIESITGQSYLNWELLLINDGSSDSSGEICNKYSEKDPRIKVYHKINGGVSSARNLGLDKASGEFVTFIDSDDWIEPHTLDLYVRCQQKYDADVVRIGFVRDYPDGRSIPTVCNEALVINDKPELATIVSDIGYYGFNWNSLYRRKLIGNLRFLEDINWCEDHIFSYQYYDRCRSVVLLPEAPYHYIQNSSSLSSNKDIFMKVKSTIIKYEARNKLYSDDVEKMSIEKNNIKIYITEQIADLYYNFPYPDRKRFYHLYKDLFNNYPSFIGKCFFSNIPFPIKDLLLVFRIKLLRC